MTTDQSLPVPGLASDATATTSVARVHYRTIQVDGVDVFYREAGPDHAPALLLLHGFPTSSHMFRELIPRLADRYRVIAPDYPGFGYSAVPDRGAFAYTFENMALVIDRFTQAIGLDRYGLYVMDYGAPVGYRLALAHPDRVTSLIVQNGNAYEEGLGEFWAPVKKYWQDRTKQNRDALRALLKPESTRWQYTNGVADTSLLSPDTWSLDQAGLDRAGNDEIQLDLFYDYRSNVPLYPRFQQYFRDYQPPALVIWGKNDAIFLADGATPYRRDLPKAEIHLLDTGHFALETHSYQIGCLIQDFLARHGER
ncbi:MAG: alpha/beta fold hydrolase [Bryobacteraceae bacterium]